MSDESDVSRVTPDQARSELARLASLLKQANIDYHQNDNPTLSDAEYDRLKRRNAALERQFAGLKRNDSPSDQIGAAAAEGCGESGRQRRRQGRPGWPGWPAGAATAIPSEA